MAFTLLGVLTGNSMPTEAKLKRIVGTVGKIANSYGMRNSYVVGGYPRAVILGVVKEDTHDLDFASAWPGEATKLGSMAASELTGKLPEIYHRTGTIKFEYEGVDLEFQGVLGSTSELLPVREQLDKYGIVLSPLNLNIYSRDFTINTLIQDIITKEMYDVTGFGTKDIFHGIIRTPIDPDVTIPINPMIILRAIRFALRYDFSIERKLSSAMRRYSDLVFNKYTPERLQIEVLKMLKQDYDGTMQMLQEYDMEGVLSNRSYNIYNILDKVNLETYEGDLSELITGV